MFCIRIRLEHKALDILDAIIPYTDKRKSLAVQLVYECGFDVWEAISEETTRVRFRHFPNTESSHGDSSVPVEGLTRQYWAREILGVMSRSRAVGVWLPFLANPMADNVPYEKLLGSFGAFFGEDIESVKHIVLFSFSISLLNVFVRYSKNLVDSRWTAENICARRV